MLTSQQKCVGESCPVDSLDLAELREIELDRNRREAKKWEALLKMELKFSIAQGQDLLELKERLNLRLKNIHPPLEIAQENMSARTKFKGADKIEDSVEGFLKREIETLKRAEEELNESHEKLNAQLEALRAARNEIEVDIANKTLEDKNEECSRLLQSLVFRGGTPSTPDRSNPTSATEKPNSAITRMAAIKTLIKNSQAERNSSQLLFTAITRKMIQSADACFAAWYETNAAFDKRILKITNLKEVIDAQLEKHASKIKVLKCQHAKVEKLLNGKRQELQQAHAELEQRRGEATDSELCKDKGLIARLREIQTIKAAIQKFAERHDKVGQVLEEELAAKASLEHDLKFKMAALRIDRDKCLALRQIFPISTFKASRFPKRGGPTGEGEDAANGSVVVRQPPQSQSTAVDN